MSTARRGPRSTRPLEATPPPRSGLRNDGNRHSTGAVLSTTARVVKKVTPPQKGSQQWARRYGAALVCVRYREDASRATRYTTVELVVDVRQLPLRPHTLILVSIAPEDETTRRKAIELGAKWKRRDKAWLIPLHAAIQLDLTNLTPELAGTQVPWQR
jgi:hypothetical protein